MGAGTLDDRGGPMNQAHTSLIEITALINLGNLVGGRGIEPLTPSMSRKQP